jgi:hypothetical protein
MTPDVAKLLHSMPDLEPPADGWQRLVARQARLGRMRWGGKFAVAASVIVVFTAVVGALYLDWPGFTASPVIQPIIVSAPAMRPEDRAIEARVWALQQRSQQMERLLGELPPRGRVAYADMAGVIAELEDRIAAVDYQLNKAGLNRSSADRQQSGRLNGRLEQADAPDLWRRRVEFMDQLVRARYVESGAEGF